jgi:hypothetical protein
VYFGTDPDPFANPDLTKPVTIVGDPNDQQTLDLSADYPSGLTTNTDYYWGVNNGGTDSEIWVFSTRLAPLSDLNGDGVVNLLDFALLAQGWQTTYDLSDLKDMAAAWMFGT